MSGELLVVGFILALISAVLVGGFVWNRREVQRLAASDVLTAPILATGKLTALLLVVAVTTVAGVVLVAVQVGLDPKEHAAFVVILAVLLGSAAPALAVYALYDRVKIGELRHEAASLSLSVNGQRAAIDLARPFSLTDGWSEAGGAVLSVVYVQQDDEHIVFSYPFASAGAERLPQMSAVGPNAGAAGKLMRERLLANPNVERWQPEPPSA